MDARVLEVVNAYVNTETKVVGDKLTAAETDFEFIKAPEQLVEYPRVIRALTNLRSNVLNINLTFNKDKPKETLKKQFESAIIEHGNKEIALNDKYEQLVQQKEQEIVTAAQKHNIELKEQLDSHNQVYIELEEKRKKLESYKDEVMELCSNYGITTSDVSVTNSSFTVDELNDVYDSYIKYMSRNGNKVNIVRKFRNVVKDNPYIEFIVFLLFCFIVFTPVLDIVSIIFFMFIIVMQLKIREKMKSFSILLGLLYNVQPLQMGFKADVDSAALLPETVDEDNNPELLKIADAWEKDLSSMDELDPMLEYEALMKDYSSSVSDIDKIFAKSITEFNDRKSKLVQRVYDRLSRTQEEFEEKKKTMVKLGDSISNSPVFNTKFKLGLEEGILEREYDVGMQNIIINPTSDLETHKMFLHVLLANAICNVKVNQLSVYVYDPNGSGYDVMGFYADPLEDVLIFRNDNLDSTLKEMRDTVEFNMKTMGGLTINEFNTEAASVGKTPKPYKLLLVLSQPKTIEENEALKSFMSYSARFGVFVWAVMSTAIKDTKIFKKPFDGIQNPYRIDMKTFCRHVSEVWVKAREENKVDGLNWLDYKEVANKDQDIWTKHTDEYIDIDPGFHEGDPSKFQGYTLGHDGDVHCIIVGGTGAGKSVFMNQMIINAARKYSPRDLELWLADYKGSEFAKYLSTREHPKRLPHIRACLCTSDGEYAGSLYTALRSEAERRYGYIIKTGCKDLKEYNKYVRKGMLYEFINGHGEKEYTKSATALGEEYRQLGPDDLLSRILFINDEFQVIFEKAEPKTVEQINKDITYIAKVARACGVHLIFGSQSMNGTMKQDTLGQFTLRIALRCNEDVSRAILGTTFASDIKQRFGLLYVSSLSDKSKMAQKRFKTPYFASDEDFRVQIDMLADRAEKEHFPERDVIEYDEKTKRYIEEVDSDYNRAKEILDTRGIEMPKGLLILGERMTYSANKLPENIILGCENNTHIISGFTDNNDLVNFYRTVRKNIAHDPEAKVFVNSQVADLHYICEVDKEFVGEEAIATTPKTSVASLISMFEAAYMLRKEGEKKSPAQYYILLGWDKGPGFIIDKNFGAIEKFANILQTCGEYGMHFIFILTGTKGIDSKLNSACAYKVCGKVTEDMSFDLLGNRLGAKGDESLRNGYMYLSKLGIVTRCKIYQSVMERQVQSKELII